jgi:ParB/RepB/Spo0J family partition protein
MSPVSDTPADRANRKLASKPPKAAVSPSYAHTVVYVAIDSIYPDPRNPRHHSPDQIRRIAESFRAFGINAPILVDHRGKIVVGHGRWEAAKLAGYTQVPVIRLEHLSDQRAVAADITASS